MAFSSTRFFKVSPNLVLPIAEDLATQLIAEGYDVHVQSSVGNDIHISLSKGGMFQKILGYQTALNVMLSDQGDSIKAETKVGIFKRQVIPTIITLFIAWPVVLSQIAGLVRQHKLDGHVMELIDYTISHLGSKATVKKVSKKGAYCPNCGARISSGKFCGECGERL